MSDWGTCEIKDCDKPAMHRGSNGSICCMHHIQLGGIPSDWHSECDHYYEIKKKEDAKLEMEGLPK